MRTPAIAALGIAAYAVFLGATVPASVVAARVRNETQGRVQLAATTGTLWRGTANALIAAPGGPLALERIEWRFRPLRLAMGRVAFDVSAASPGLEARSEIARSLSAWEARNLEARGNAATLATAFPWIAGWRPEGTMLVSSPSFSWDDRSARGEVRAEWRGVALALSDVRPLGDYRAELRADGGPAKVTLSTLDGPLRLSGIGSVSPRGRFEFSGDARAQGANARSLDPLLDLLGPRRADGSRALEWKVN